MRNLLAGVQGGPELARGDIERIAARILGREDLAPGCDGRDIAYAMGLEVCHHAGPTRVRKGVLFYDERLHYRERNVRICVVLATVALEAGGIATSNNVQALSYALTRRYSGMLSRSG